MTMNRRWLVALMLILTVLVTSACAAQPGAVSAQEEVAQRVISALDQNMPSITLPRLVVAYDTDGVPSLFGIKTTTLEGLLPGVSLAFLNLPPQYMDWFARSNLQHVEVEVHESGVFLYANGQPLPYLAWGDASLDQTGDLLDSMDLMQFDSIINQALPLLQRLGVDLVLQFPRAEGAEAIALRDRGDRMEAVAAVEPSAVVNVGVQYTDEGLPTVMGLTSRDLLSLGVDLRFMELPGFYVDYVQAINLQRLEAVTQPDGLYLYVNDNELPHLAYTEEHLSNAIDLYAQLYGENMVTSLLRRVVPILPRANIDLAVDLPGSQMAY